MKFNDGEKKFILKETFKPLLPDDVLYRKKMGFSVPLARWFREHIKCLAERYLLNENAGLAEFVKLSSCARVVWDEQRPLDGVSSNNT